MEKKLLDAEHRQGLVLATSNAGKVKEIIELLEDHPFAFSNLRDHFDPPPVIPETGDSFEVNARMKARWVYDKLGLWSLADDSGLLVDFLNGAPGVRSARYAGESATDHDNVRKLLESLTGVSDFGRTARFKCVIVLKTDTVELVASGVCEGHIGTEARGDQGFGYDPVFFPAGFKQTFAQLDPRVKNAISHRGKALLNLRKELRRHYGERHF